MGRLWDIYIYNHHFMIWVWKYWLYQTIPEAIAMFHGDDQLESEWWRVAVRLHFAS